MIDLTASFETDLDDLDEPGWSKAIALAGRENGFFEPLGEDHEAIMIRGGDRLLVTFERAATVRTANEDAEPLGWRFVRSQGWSSLTVLARDETWYRDPAVFDLFDRLTDEGIFDEYESVLFHGNEAAGYAACAFSVAAPGARVVAIRPQATLDARLAGWDLRFRSKRRLDFRGRYGYAPDMIEAADHAWILFDPECHDDAMHAALFARANVTLLRTPHLGWKVAREMEAMRVLDRLLVRAMDGTLSELEFARLFRARRRHPPYLRALLSHLDDSDRPGLAARLCRYGTEATGRPIFARKLEKLRAQGLVPDDGAAEGGAAEGGAADGGAADGRARG